MKQLLIIGILSTCLCAVGQQNTSLGELAGNNSTGLRNTSIGHYAGFKVEGFENTLVGGFSGWNLTQGARNTFSGIFSGKDMITGSENTFIGYWAGSSNSSGNWNTYTGSFAGGRVNTPPNTQPANYNSFYGHKSGSDNYGNENSFYGAYSGENNTSGRMNLFIGTGSGRNNRFGSRNSYLGYTAGHNSIGSDNVFIGYQAGYNEEGSNQLYISNSDTAIPLIYGDFSKGAVGIGTKSLGGNQFVVSGNTKLDNLFADTGDFSGKMNAKEVSTGKVESALVETENLTSKEVFSTYLQVEQDAVIQNGTLQILHKSGSRPATKLYVEGDAIATGIWISSDKRYKENEKVISSSLSSIKKLDGKSYNFTQKAKTMRAFSDERNLGFIAQDVKEVFPELVREDNNGYLAVNYIGLIPVLTEAVKELDSKISKVEEENTLLKEQNATLISWIKENAKALDIPAEVIKTKSYLNQNYPNPTEGKSSIGYELPEGALNATIHVYDLQGREVKVYNNLTNKGEIQINTTDLEKGFYNYSLVVDGQLMETKKMLVKE